MWRQVSDELMDRLRDSQDVKQVVADLEKQVYSGQVTPGRASDLVLRKFVNK
jgi:hypothetical protein